MPMLSPVICQKCGVVAFESFPIYELLGGVTSYGSAVSVDGSRCPKCGGHWQIPDGQYVGDKITFFRADQYRLVVDALRQLSEMAKQGMSADEISETIDREYPYLQILKRHLGKSMLAFAAFCGLLTKCVEWLANKEGQPAVEFHIENLNVQNFGDVNVAFDDIASKLSELSQGTIHSKNTTQNMPTSQCPSE